MIVAVDAMGGDKAPLINIEGALYAAREGLADVILVGDQAVLTSYVQKMDTHGLPISIHHASQVIEMHEAPAQACRQKKDSSLMVCAQLVAEKKADAFISAGNSGAAMAASLMQMKRINGIIRPAIASLFPTIQGKSLILDVGANVDSKPEHLVQCAIMGSVYMQHIYGVVSPRVGLLSIGEEESKGNALTGETFALLRKTSLNFIGNIEGRDIPFGAVDVIVCDGFVGNVVIKLSEGLAFAVLSFLKDEIKKNIIRKAGYFLLHGAFSEMKKKIDFNEYGGAPLLGIDGDAIICHGASDALAIKNAIRVATEFVKHRVNDAIRDEIIRCGIAADEKNEGHA